MVRTVMVAFGFLILALICFMNNENQSKSSYAVTEELNKKNPVITWTTKFPWVKSYRTIKCFNRKCDITPGCYKWMDGDAYLFYAFQIERGLLNFPLPKGKNTIWALFHEETPSQTLPLMHENVLSVFNFSATYSRFSDVPITMMWLDSLMPITSLSDFVNTSTKNVLLQSIAPVMYVQSDCDTALDRDEYVQKLQEYIRIDSYGGCLQNKLWPLDYSIVDSVRYYTDSFDDTIFLTTIAKYKFYLAIENSQCNDYITEKFWRAIKLGVVPIYFGSPLIRDWLPNKRSAILVEDFPTPELLSAHLHELLQNDTKSEEYLEHKTKGLVTNKRLYEEIKARPYQTDILQAVNKLQCLVCERIHDKNSTQVNIVTKKHFDCPLPVSVLTRTVNPQNHYLRRVERMRADMSVFVRELSNPNIFNKRVIIKNCN